MQLGVLPPSTDGGIPDKDDDDAKSPFAARLRASWGAWQSEASASSAARVAADSALLKPEREERELLRHKFLADEAKKRAEQLAKAAKDALPTPASGSVPPPSSQQHLLNGYAHSDPAHYVAAAAGQMTMTPATGRLNDRKRRLVDVAEGLPAHARPQQIDADWQQSLRMMKGVANGTLSEQMAEMQQQQQQWQQQQMMVGGGGRPTGGDARVPPYHHAAPSMPTRAQLLCSQQQQQAMLHQQQAMFHRQPHHMLPHQQHPSAAGHPAPFACATQPSTSQSEVIPMARSSPNNAALDTQPRSAGSAPSGHASSISQPPLQPHQQDPSPYAPTPPVLCGGGDGLDDFHTANINIDNMVDHFAIAPQIADLGSNLDDFFSDDGSGGGGGGGKTADGCVDHPGSVAAPSNLTAASPFSNGAPSVSAPTPTPQTPTPGSFGAPLCASTPIAASQAPPMQAPPQLKQAPPTQSVPPVTSMQSIQIQVSQMQQQQMQQFYQQHQQQAQYGQGYGGGAMGAFPPGYDVQQQQQRMLMQQHYMKQQQAHVQAMMAAENGSGAGGAAAGYPAYPGMSEQHMYMQRMQQQQRMMAAAQNGYYPQQQQQQPFY